MTARRDTILWGLFGGGLIILYLLSSTDWIIKEKKNEVYPVSIIIRDVSDDYYANFRKGVEQAADEYNVDVSFLTLYERGDTRQQMELAGREIRDGAGAVVLEPANAVECMRYLDERTYESPMITVGEMLPSSQVAGAVFADYGPAGRQMGEAILRENPEELPVYIFSELPESEAAADLRSGLTAVLEEKGRQVKYIPRESPDTYRMAIEDTVYPGNGKAIIAALDPASTAEAADIISGSPVYGDYIAGLYGTGTTPSLLNQMDKGVIRGMAVANEFDLGYFAVKKAVEAIQPGGTRAQMNLDTYYIEKKALRDPVMEKMLYPID